MGTNFYIIGAPEDDRGDPEWHLGKRSAAGAYCWDCETTLCKGGREGVHYSKHGWYEVCPVCGKGTENEENWGAAGRELGFNKEKPSKKTGVKSCSSFSWAMDPNSYKINIAGKVPLQVRLHNIIGGEIGKVIEDEYGRKFTIVEFEELLQECPLQYTNNIGKWFS